MQCCTAAAVENSKICLSNALVGRPGFVPGLVTKPTSLFNETTRAKETTCEAPERNDCCFNGVREKQLLFLVCAHLILTLCELE